MNQQNLKKLLLENLNYKYIQVVIILLELWNFNRYELYLYTVMFIIFIEALPHFASKEMRRVCWPVEHTLAVQNSLSLATLMLLHSIVASTYKMQSTRDEKASVGVKGVSGLDLWIFQTGEHETDSSVSVRMKLKIAKCILFLSLQKVEALLVPVKVSLSHF